MIGGRRRPAAGGGLRSVGGERRSGIDADHRTRVRPVAVARELVPVRGVARRLHVWWCADNLSRVDCAQRGPSHPLQILERMTSSTFAVLREPARRSWTGCGFDGRPGWAMGLVVVAASSSGGSGGGVVAVAVAVPTGLDHGRGWCRADASRLGYYQVPEMDSVRARPAPCHDRTRIEPGSGGGASATSTRDVSVTPDELTARTT